MHNIKTVLDEYADDVLVYGELTACFGTENTQEIADMFKTVQQFKTYVAIKNNIANATDDALFIADMHD